MTNRFEPFLGIFFPELALLTGVAAILRFPMPDLEDNPLDSEEEME